MILTNAAAHAIITESREKPAGVAQPVEQLICNQQVGGSNPSTSSTDKQTISYGGIPEWPKGADCKSVVSDFGGSNPPSPTKNELMKVSSFFCCMKRKISSSPRADSIFSFSLFFARPSSFGAARFLFLLRGSAAVPVSAACAAGKLRRTIAAARHQVQRTC